jgi:endonuclease-3
MNKAHKLSSSVATRIVQILVKKYTQKADMDMENGEDTLLAVLLSAQTTDKQVLKVFPSFRKKFPTWESLASAKVSAIAKSINTIGLYPAKAKAIHATAKKILHEFSGKIPNTMDALVTLPGVGRKTASCVLAYVFHTPAIAVDTHVFRIAHRMGLSNGKTVEQVERDLKAVIPKRLWIQVNFTMVQFGRDICTGGKKPACWKCPVKHYCLYPHKTMQS